MADSPRLRNLMWELLGTGDGSFYFDNFANVLDQFLELSLLSAPAVELFLTEQHLIDLRATIQSVP